MHSRRVVLSVLALAGQSPLLADLAGGDPRKEKLYGRFMAPCCWNGNLLTHRSPLADRLRERISGWIVAGQSDDEIRDRLVDEYSLRILALPEGQRAQWLSWSPVVLAGAGLAWLAMFVRQSLRRGAAQPAGLAPLSGADFDPDLLEPFDPKEKS